MFVDAFVTFGKGAFKDTGEGYSWPTAGVIVSTIYEVTATDEDGNTVIVLRILIQTENGEILNWTIIQ